MHFLTQKYELGQNENFLYIGEILLNNFLCRSKVGGGGGGTQSFFLMTFLASNYVGFKKPWPSGELNQSKIVNKRPPYHDLLLEKF